MAGQEGIEEIKARLNNIRSVEPILGAMRTISLGTWQGAIRRKGHLLRYSERLLELLPALAAALSEERRRRSQPARPPAPVAIVAIGSERGLVGAFNSSLVRYVERQLDRLEGQGQAVELHVLGARLSHQLQRAGHSVSRSHGLPMSALPSHALARELVYAWLARYEAHELDAVYVIYNAYRNSTLYEPATVQLIPPPLPSPGELHRPWPLPYIDTDPLQIYAHAAVLWIGSEMYRILLDSAAAEHSARYQLMEGAVQNSTRLIDELTLDLQEARQQAITAEMQELAAGAGLLGSQEP